MISEKNSNPNHVIEKFFNEYPIIGGDCELVLCWSGGKDSTALLLLMASYKRKKKLPLTVLMVPYPKITINEDGRKETLQFWEKNGISIRVLDHNYPDPENLPKHEICAQCKEIRRKVLVERYFQSCDLTKTIIATGHNSWDLVAYLIEVIISRLASSSTSHEIGSYHRYLEVMNKFLPVYHAKDGPTIIRPMLHLGDDDALSVINQEYAPFPFSFIPDPCPWLEQRKRILHNYFQSMGTKFKLENLIRYAEEVCELPNIEMYSELPFQTYLL